MKGTQSEKGMNFNKKSELESPVAKLKLASQVHA